METAKVAEVPPTSMTTTTLTQTVAPDAHQLETIIKILGWLAGACIIGLIVIGGFSIYLQTMTPPREAGSSVGALRENIMAILSGVTGALIMKARGGTTP